MGLIYGNALEFNGSTQYARRASAGSSVINNFSMACWVYILAYPLADSIFFQNAADDARGESMRITISGVLNVDYHFVANLSSGFTLVLNTWYHVGLIRNAGTSQIYVNGATQGGTIANAPNTGTDYITLGASNSSGGVVSKYTNCRIDDARFYERAISGAEMSTLYTNGSIFPYTDISNANLFEFYKTDETTGTDVSDSSGGGRNLTTSGTPLWVKGIVPIAVSPFLKNTFVRQAVKRSNYY